MNILIALLIGALMGGPNGVGIFFEPREPYKIEILLAATLKGVLISLLTGFSLARGARGYAAPDLECFTVLLLDW